MKQRIRKLLRALGYDVRGTRMTPRQLLDERLLRAVEPFLLPFADEPDLTIENAVALLRQAGRIQSGDKLIVVTDILSQDRLIDSVQLRTVR